MTPRRRLVLVLVLTPLLMVAAHSVMWFWAVGQLEQQAGLAIAQARAAGWQVSSAPAVRGGWPLGASLAWGDVRLAGSTPTGPLAYGAERIELQTSLTHPTRADLVFTGAQSLQLGSAPAVGFIAERMVGALSVTPGSPARVATLDADGLRIGGERAMTIGHLAGNLDLQPANHPFALAARDVILPDPGVAGLGNWALGNQLHSLALDGSLSGNLPGPPGPPFAAWFAKWREGAGQLTVGALALQWGPLDLTVSATLEGDARGQPNLAANLRVVGWSESADALVAAGVLSRDVVKPAKAFLSLLARVPGPGAPSELELPLSLRDGRLSVARLPVMQLPPLE